MKRKKAINKVLMKYVNEFCKKHDTYFEYAVNDNLLDVICIGDSFFNIDDLIKDLDNKCPKDVIWNWYSETIDRAMENKQTMNFNSWVGGLRYGDL